ncbi:hypothetical protein SDC9_71204 [bioreactor metagenome]|uniref:Uncharacterized protein n=1 Tax=bioreactor metagenome TaxID=1076179 RepID=A0A644Y8T6_9ZZZZ
MDSRSGAAGYGGDGVRHRHPSFDRNLDRTDDGAAEVDADGDGAVAGEDDAGDAAGDVVHPVRSAVGAYALLGGEPDFQHRADVLSAACEET